MASQLSNQMTNWYGSKGRYSTCYEMTVANDYSITTPVRIGGVNPLTSNSGEIIIKLDWSELSVAFNNSSTDIAWVTVPKLLSTTFLPELGGKSLAEFPIHLIGHSRGGSVVAEMARYLGAQGVWVDHLTTLDPHPLAEYSDADIYLYANVLFADNYWQTNPGFFCPNGEFVSGAYNRYLSNLLNGYDCSHSDAHLWYHGTIDFRLPASVSEESIALSERQTWWAPNEVYGSNAGFYYSHIGRGDRLSTNRPAGTNTDRIRDGYNQIWNFGAGTSGNRYALPSNNGAWPNLIRFNILGTNSVAQGNPIALKYFIQNAQDAAVAVFLDDDFNPYNGYVSQIAQTNETGLPLNYVRPNQLSVDTCSITQRQYAVFARIAAGGRTRYLYAPEILTIQAPRYGYTVSPAERSHGNGATNGNVTVTTQSACAWTASSGCDWVHITAGASGTGNGSVAYSVDTNPTCTARNCTLTIAGKTFTVRQAAGIGSFAIAPTENTLGPDADGGTVLVAASSPDCGWAATESYPWIQITSGATGTGNGSVTYTVDANPNCISRTGLVAIAGKMLTVIQAAGAGTYSITPTNRAHVFGRSSATVTVNAGLGCAWTAINNDGWIIINSGSNGFGGGLVSYSVLSNSDLASRTGSVTIAGNTFTVMQAGTPPDTNRPFAFINLPKANEHFTNAQVHLLGSASDDRAVARVEYQLGTNAPQSADGTSVWMAEVQAVPGTNLLRFWSVDTSDNVSTTNTRSFHFSRVPLAKGTYNGLFREDDLAHHESSGSFKLTVAEKSTYSGTLLSRGKSHAVTGRFSPAGEATNTIMRSKTNLLTIRWMLDLEALDRITGAVSSGNWTSTLSGDRSFFNAKSNPTTNAGKYTLLIPGLPDTSNAPEGDGYGTVTVGLDGKVTLAASLAEGTKVSTSAPLTKDGTWPLFASLYGGKGSVLSWVRFAKTETNDFNGDLHWFKPAFASSNYYTNGFAITNMLIGSRYIPPAGATNRILSMTNGIVIFYGGSRLQPVTNEVVLGAKGKVTNISSNKLAFTFTLSSGLFSGTFTETGGGTKVTFQGAAFQNENRGAGYFLDASRSGRVLLQAGP